MPGATSRNNSPSSRNTSSSASNRAKLFTPGSSRPSTNSPANPQVLHGVPSGHRDVTILGNSALKELKSYARQDVKQVVKIDTGMDISHQRERKSQVHSSDMANTRKAQVKARGDAVVEQEKSGVPSGIARRDAGLGEEHSKAKAADLAINSKAATARDAQLDEVKRMEEMVQYALSAYQRDSQKAANVDRLSAEKQEALDYDAMMMKAYADKEKEYEARAAVRKEKLEAGKAVLIGQVKEHENQEVLRKAAVEAEGAAMLAQLQRQKEEDEARDLEKAEKRRGDLVSNLDANKQAIAARQAAKEAEEEEDRQIAAFMRDRDRRAQEEAAEAARQQEEKEKMWARMRESQKRVMDNRAEQDELRARRHQELVHRRERQKAEAKEAKKEEQKAEVMSSHKEQMRWKMEKHEQEVARDRAERQRLLGEQQKDIEAAKAAEIEKERKRLMHTQALHSQLDEKAERSRKELLERDTAGATIKQQQEAHMSKLENIRQQKLEALRAKGVPEQYLHELLTADLDTKKIPKHHVFKL